MSDSAADRFDPDWDLIEEGPEETDVVLLDAQEAVDAGLLDSTEALS